MDGDSTKCDEWLEPLEMVYDVGPMRPGTAEVNVEDLGA
jgi:hypothetical protein